MQTHQIIGLTLLTIGLAVGVACCNHHVASSLPEFFGSMTVKLNAFVCASAGGIILLSSWMAPVRSHE